MRYGSLVALLSSLFALSATGCFAPLDDSDASAGGSSQAAALQGSLGGSHVDTSYETVSVQWNESALAAIRTTNAGPTIAARALAELHTAAFDAWTAYSDDATPTQTAVTRQPHNTHTDNNKRVAISFAAYRVLTDLFPTEELSFRKRLAHFGGDPADASTVQTSASGVGNAAAAAILLVRREDASNQLGDITPGAYSDYTGYSPINTSATVNDPNRWQPLRVNGATADQAFVTPQWQNVLPFGLTDPTAFRPAAPSQFGSARYEKQARGVLDLSANLDDRAKVIAEYWSDGVGTAQSPGHWLELAQFVSARDRHSVDDDAKLFFALGNAMLDTSIAVWEAKRFYDAERPITAIHTLFAGKQVYAWAGPGKGTHKIDGAKWQPYDRADEVTPASADAAAEESAFAFAAAEVLERFTQSDFFGADFVAKKKSSNIEPGITPRRDVRLCWRTFDDAAREASRAGQLRGVHFEDSDLAGRTMGKAIGAEAWKAALVHMKEAHASCQRQRAHQDCDAYKD